MRVLLVRPGRRKQAITLGEFMFAEPIGLECVYSVLKDTCQVKILDLMIEGQDFTKELQDFQPEVVGFTSYCIDVLAVLELAETAKKINPRLITLVGGTQALLAPESFYNDYVDYIFEYTTKENLLEFFDSLSRGEEIPPIAGVRSRRDNYPGTGTKGLNEYIIPDRSSTAGFRRHYSYFGYKPCAIMQTSMGCSTHCKFCLRWKIEGPVEQDRPLTEVIDQIAGIEEPSIMFYDNNFLYNPGRLQEFCQAIETRGIRKNFICYGSARSIAAQPELMQRLGKIGLRAVLVGYESFRDEDLASYHKPSTVAVNLEAARILKAAGIDCWASFILHPDWSTKDFREFRRCLKQLRPEISSLSPMTPFPAGLLYRQYQDRLLFPKEAYDQWSFSVVSIRPSQMSLRRYYLEVMQTNLYVNLCLNNSTYLVRKFGWRTMVRLLKGSLKFGWTYTKLMLKG